MLTEANIPTIVNGLAGGKSMRQICRDEGWAESTVRLDLAQQEQWVAQTARAREIGSDAIADECIEIADNTSEEPADRRIRIDTRLKLIGKWSQRYSDRVKIVGGTPGEDNPVQHQHGLMEEMADEVTRSILGIASKS